jgi:hypothetical protein
MGGERVQELTEVWARPAQETSCLRAKLPCKKSRSVDPFLRLLGPSLQKDQLRALAITKSRKTLSLAWLLIASG